MLITPRKPLGGQQPTPVPNFCQTPYTVQMQQCNEVDGKDPGNRLRVSENPQADQTQPRLKSLEEVHFNCVIQHKAASPEAEVPSLHFLLVFKEDIPLWKHEYSSLRPSPFTPQARSPALAVQFYHP